MMVILALWGVAAALLLASVAAGWSARRRVEAAGRWPTVQGRIVGTAIESRGNGTYAPQVSYAYSVGGRGYASDRLRPGGVPFFYSEAKAWAVAAPYDEGAPVTVHHHPAKPARAAIELVPLSHAVLLLRVLAGAMAFVALLVTIGI